MASREEDITQIADKLPPNERVARETQLDAAMGQLDKITGYTISPDSDVPEPVRQLRKILKPDNATLHVPEGTPPELADAVRKQFEASKAPQQPAKQEGFFTRMATQLYDGLPADERGALLGSDEERTNAIQKAINRHAEDVARQMEALGRRQQPDAERHRPLPRTQDGEQPPKPKKMMGEPEAGLSIPDRAAATSSGQPDAGVEEKGRRASRTQGYMPPEVAAMMAALEAYKQLGPKMAERLPGLIGDILKGTAEGKQYERATPPDASSVPHIDGTKKGFSIPGIDHATLAAKTEEVRRGLQEHIKGGDSSPGAEAAMRAQELILKMNARSMGGPAMSGGGKQP